MIITLICPEHGAWHPDLKDHRSRSTCPTPGCKVRGVPRAGQFRSPAAGTPVPAAEPEPDNGVRLADVDSTTSPLHPALRAMVRLMLSATCARYHLREARSGGHLSGISAGPTQRGKTLAATVVCRALGLDEVACIRQAGRETELSLWGRRAQEPGGRYVLTPAAVLALPFVALDELDKATGALLKAALRLLQGDARVDAEGQPVDIAPTAYATSNAGLGMLPESYRRRSACLDSTGLPEVSHGLARRVLGQVPRLILRCLAPPATELPSVVLDRMEAALRAGLTAHGWVLCDVRALELAALGRAGLTGSDMADAAMRTVVDYLELAATTREAHPAWMDHLDAWASGKQGPATGEPAGQREAEPEAAEDAYRHRAEAVIAAGTIGHRLKRAIEDLADAAELPGAPAAMLDRAAGLTQTARRLVGPDLGKARDVARVAEILPAAQDVIWLAEDLAEQMHAATAGFAAREYQADYEAAIAAELHLRAQVQPAAIESRPAARPIPPPTVEETLAAYRRWRYPQKGLGGRPTPPAASTGTGLMLRPAWTIPASPEPAPGPQPRRAPAGPSAATRLAAARAARLTLPAADTSVADALTALTQQRADAGLPPLTGAEIAQLYLPATRR